MVTKIRNFPDIPAREEFVNCIAGVASGPAMPVPGREDVPGGMRRGGSHCLEK